MRTILVGRKNRGKSRTSAIFDRIKALIPDRKYGPVSRLLRRRILPSANKTTVEYNTYIRSAAWRKKRETALRFHGSVCAQCGALGDLQVHHLNYGSLGREEMADLVVFCRRCHYKSHLPDPEQECTDPASRQRDPGSA